MSLGAIFFFFFVCARSFLVHGQFTQLIYCCFNLSPVSIEGESVLLQRCIARSWWLAEEGSSSNCRLRHERISLTVRVGKLCLPHSSAVGLTQLVECVTFNHLVAGSSPVFGCEMLFACFAVFLFVCSSSFVVGRRRRRSSSRRDEPQPSPAHQPPPQQQPPQPCPTDAGDQHASHRHRQQTRGATRADRQSRAKATTTTSTRPGQSREQLPTTTSEPE